MGLSVREMLQDDHFSQCRLLAGRGGLDKQIQGVAVYDAPDGINYTQGRELIVSSGYVFKQNPDLYRHLTTLAEIRLTTAMGFKERYLEEGGIPQFFLDFCDENDIPLFIVPPDIPWMSLMNRLNIIVMNSNIKRFNVDKTDELPFSSSSYQAQMILKILGQIEREMHFPALLYELASDNVYRSSQNVHMPVPGLELRHFWEPLPEFGGEMLCEELNMVRYRHGQGENGVAYSWITVPVTLKGETKAYFVVIESTGIIDYFDQFSIRIGFLLLQSMYEQIVVARRLGDAGFKTLLLDVLSGALTLEESIAHSAAEVGLDVRARYYMVAMRQNNPDYLLANHADQVRSIMGACMGEAECKLAPVEENLAVFVVKAGENQARDMEAMEAMFGRFEERVRATLPQLALTYAVADTPFPVVQMKDNYGRCLQALQMGGLLQPDRSFHRYTDLGIFAWLNVREEDQEWMLKDLQVLLDADDKHELVDTLETYLASNMNFTLTAKRMYLHINTVRKRIQDVEDRLQYDLNDPMARLNLEILIKLFKNRAVL